MAMGSCMVAPVNVKLLAPLAACGLAGVVSAFIFGGLLDESFYRGKVGLNDKRIDALCSTGRWFA
jgi:ABC-type uncharacterized transport system YnjBCD ATPase subunit